jgi:WD40 repeat protein
MANNFGIAGSSRLIALWLGTLLAPMAGFFLLSLVKAEDLPHHRRRVGSPVSFKGHMDGLAGLEFGNRSKLLVSGGWDGQVRLWNTSKRDSRLVKGLPERIWDLKLSPDNRWLAVLSRESKPLLLIADIGTARVRTQIPLAANGSCLSISPDGRWLVVGDFHGEIHVWDTKSWKKSFSVGCSSCEFVLALALSSDGKQLAVSDENEGVSLYSFPTLAKRKVIIEGDTPRVHALAWCKHDSGLLAGDYEGTVQCIDIRSCRKLWSVKGRGEVCSLATSPDGKSLAVSYWEPFLLPISARIAKHLVAYVRTWDMQSGRQVRGYTGYECGGGRVAYSRDGKWLATSDYVGNIILQPSKSNGGEREDKGRKQVSR